jgi:simple sugar transport system ATP-binding protein
MPAAESDSRTLAMLRMRGIHKSYGGVRANRNIDLDVAAGRIVGLLGENGSGKTTLMNVLYGMVPADAGEIVFDGRPLVRHTPRDAIAAGIGMIHQHFMLVPAMTVTDNVMLGWDGAGTWLRRRHVAARVAEASRAYGLGLDPSARVGALSLGAQQRVEIVKAVLRGARLLILDEPTSNLSPPEVAALLGILRRLRSEDRSVIFISHKLAEVVEVCDEVVVLRDGEVAGACPVAGVAPDDLARLMVGRDLPPPAERTEHGAGRELLIVSNVSVAAGGRPVVDAVSFSVRAGEVFAIAGVDGNGQAELAEVVGGLRIPARGRVFVDGADVTEAGVRGRLASGLAHIPADRRTRGLVPGMTIAENIALRESDRAPFRRGLWIDAAAAARVAAQRMAGFDVRATGPGALVARLSGGTQQKVVLAREIGREPAVLLAEQPTRGLDPGATRFVMDAILALRDRGAAVVYISTELDEVLAVADRVGVMYRGRLVGVVPRADVDLTRLGLMMAGAVEEYAA